MCIRDSFNRLRNKFANTKLDGAKEKLTMFKDVAIDTVADPFTLLALAFAPWTGGATLAAKQAATEAIKQGAKRYAFSQAAKAGTRPAIFTAAEGATWSGAHNYFTQDIDIDLLNRNNIDAKELALATGIGAVAGGGIGQLTGMYDGYRFFKQQYKYLNEDKIIKTTERNSRQKIVEDNTENSYNLSSLSAKAGESAKIKGAFFQRKDIPGVLRDVMGEYKNPFVNYANTVMKIAQTAENYKFEKEIQRLVADGRFPNVIYDPLYTGGKSLLEASKLAKYCLLYTSDAADE